MRVGEKNLKSVRWNDVVKTAVQGKGGAWKEMLGPRDEVVKERYMVAYKKEKRNVKWCRCQSKKDVKKQFGMKIIYFIMV